MNEKQDEHVDRRIRQALDSLPDAPPIGSAFDAGKLWERLRPELTPGTVGQPFIQPTKSRRHWRGWWVAAILVLALIGWLGSDQLTQTDRTPAAVKTIPGQPSIAESSSDPYSKGGQVESVVNDRQVVKATGVERRITSVVAVPEAKQVADETSLTSSQATLPEQSLTSPVVDAPVDDEQPVRAQTVAKAATPQRRWRVVHENELPAEDEAYQVRYRSERTVRLGSGKPSPDAADEALPALRVPLSRKSTQ